MIRQAILGRFEGTGEGRSKEEHMSLAVGSEGQERLRAGVLAEGRRTVGRKRSDYYTRNDGRGRGCRSSPLRGKPGEPRILRAGFSRLIILGRRLIDSDAVSAGLAAAGRPRLFWQG